MTTKIQTSENGGVMTTYDNIVYINSFGIITSIVYRYHQTVTCFDKNLNDYTFDLIPN